MTAMNDYSALNKYMSEGFKQVEGWCSPGLAALCELIDRHQAARGVIGGVAEIGVHHGLFYMLLNSLCDAGQKSYAIDIFEEQDLNIDSSGKGAKEIFLSNLRTHDRYGGENTQIVAGDSTAIRLHDVISSPVRFFSIDGGHTAEHTISDLNAVNDILHPEGVVILDDILNHHWLGVIEGVAEFLGRKPTLLPFAIGHNKLFMARLSHVDRYAELFRSSPYATKHNVKFFGRYIVAL